jgi:hypothetical protein
MFLESALFAPVMAASVRAPSGNLNHKEWSEFYLPEWSEF